MANVLVTGGSGFIGSHCILQLLAAGHKVSATVRDLDRAPQVRAMLMHGGASNADQVDFFAANLTQDAGWPKAVDGCDYVLHVASPLETSAPAHEDELIVPARDGTLRVLRTARDAGVKRVVQTSSFAAIGYGHPTRPQPFDETDWTDPDGHDVSAYAKSKTLAERAAWDFIAREGEALELSVVNPVAVLGPVLGRDYSASIVIVRGMLDGMIPMLPKLSFGVVDVRDVADLHLRAMTSPAAKGERFLATSGDFMSMSEIAAVLRSGLGAAARRVPTRLMPDWLLRAAALFSSTAREIVPELGKGKQATGAKSMRVLGWSPRLREEAIIATAESLTALGLLRDSPKAAA